MPTTTRLRDYLLRELDNPTPGTSEARDTLGRHIRTGNRDALDRALVATAWVASTAYALGDYVELSTGQVLTATVAGTSAAAEPTAPGYGNTVVDGGATWEQITGANPAMGLAAGATSSEFDPGEHTVDAVKSYIEDHPDEADAVTDAELEGKARTTLLDWLKERNE